MRHLCRCFQYDNIKTTTSFVVNIFIYLRTVSHLCCSWSGPGITILLSYGKDGWYSHLLLGSLLALTLSSKALCCGVDCLILHWAVWVLFGCCPWPPLKHGKSSSTVRVTGGLVSGGRGSTTGCNKTHFSDNHPQLSHNCRVTTTIEEWQF